MYNKIGRFYYYHMLDVKKNLIFLFLTLHTLLSYSTPDPLHTLLSYSTPDPRYVSLFNPPPLLYSVISSFHFLFLYSFPISTLHIFLSVLESSVSFISESKFSSDMINNPRLLKPDGE